MAFICFTGKCVDFIVSAKILASEAACERIENLMWAYGVALVSEQTA